MKVFLVSLIMILIPANSTFSQEVTPKEFSLYLLPKKIRPNRLNKIDLKKLKPTGRPFIYQYEIYSYNQDTHKFVIADYAFRNKFGKTNLTGRTFAVFVGDEAIYTGAFWSSILSQSFNGIIINLNPIDRRSSEFKIEIGYPTEKFFNGNDLRSDLRILKAFEQVGKLYDDFEVIGKCKGIKGTGKRHQSYIFTFEIVSIIKGNFDSNEVEFELFMDFGGNKMLRDLETDMMKLYDIKGWNFDKDKEFILRFDKRVGRPDLKYHWLKENDYYLKDWSSKK